MGLLQFTFTPAIPLHRQIEAMLRERIENGVLAPGSPLPDTRDMAQQMGVHPLTLQKALQRLKNDGLIDRTPRVGSFVSATDDILTRSVALALLYVNVPNLPRPALLTWANEGTRFHYGLPVIRYEIPVAQCARQLREILEIRLDGRTPPEGQTLVRGTIVDME